MRFGQKTNEKETQRDLEIQENTRVSHFPSIIKRPEDSISRMKELHKRNRCKLELFYL